MNSHLILVSCLMLLLPPTLFAATECRVVELPDRYEAICEGDEKIMAGFYNGNQKERQRDADQAARVNSPKFQATSASQPEGDRKVKSSAVERLIAFRHNKLQRSDVEAKKAIRMQMIKAGRQNEPTLHQEQTVGDI